VKITTLVHNKQIRTQQKGNPKPTGFLTAAPIGIRNEKKTNQSAAAAVAAPAAAVARNK